jgi:phosphatidylserine decarboxylase
MGSLRFSDRVARTTWRVVPKRALSGAIGWAAGLPIPVSLRSGVLRRFARIYGIETAEAEKSLDEYSRVDDFFTRRLRLGLRAIDGAAQSVVAPSDGTVVECGTASGSQLLQVKGVPFELADLLDEPVAARRLEGGSYLTTYLSPRDYHRVHAPVGGRIVGWRHIPGILFPVGAGSVEREPGLFVRNERLITWIEGDVGLCAVVMVAAVGVGNMTAAYDPDVETHGQSFLRAEVRQKDYDPGRPIEKGQELGTFHMGSTTIVVFEPGRIELKPLIPGQTTKMGEAIGTIRTRGEQAK